MRNIVKGTDFTVKEGNPPLCDKEQLSKSIHRYHSDQKTKLPYIKIFSEMESTRIYCQLDIADQIKRIRLIR